VHRYRSGRRIHGGVRSTSYREQQGTGESIARTDRDGLSLTCQIARECHRVDSKQ
jgi:hypothetical protein